MRFIFLVITFQEQCFHLVLTVNSVSHQLDKKKGQTTH